MVGNFSMNFNVYLLHGNLVLLYIVCLNLSENSHLNGEINVFVIHIIYFYNNVHLLNIRLYRCMARELVRNCNDKTQKKW